MTYSTKHSAFSEYDKELYYDVPGKLYRSSASRPPLRLSEEKELFLACSIVDELPESLEECRKLALSNGVVIIHTPLRLLDRMFESASPQDTANLTTFGHTDDITVRPLSRRGLTKVSFQDGRKRCHILNLYQFGDSAEEALRCAIDLFTTYGIGLESFVSPANILQEILLRKCRAAFLSNLDPTVEEYAFQAYKGGRFEAVELGAQDVSIYDYNGAYLYAVSLLQSTDSLHTYWPTTKPTLDDVKSDNVSYVFARCRVSIGTTRISPLFIRALEQRNPLHSKVRLVTPTEISVEVWLTKPEILVLLRFGATIEIIVGRMGIVQSDCQPFMDCAQTLYDFRNTYNRAFKLIGATAPGKMASVYDIINSDGSLTRTTSPICNFVYAAHASGLVRALITQVSLEDPTNIVRIAIDSVWKKKGSATPSVTVGEALGEMKLRSGKGVVFTDMFADKPGASKYTPTLELGSILVGDKLNYRSIFGIDCANTFGEPGLKGLVSSGFRVPCRSGKRLMHKGGNLLNEVVPTEAIKGLEELKKLLSMTSYEHIPTSWEDEL